MKKLVSSIVVVGAVGIAAAGVSLDGVWHVEGDGFSGDAKLPGTLAAAHLGKRWTEHDFQTTMDLAQSEALVQEWHEFISAHFYQCSKEMLLRLGKLYAGGGDFTASIDAAGGEGTAAFVERAIEVYCSQA
jgi:hypothetical protein